MSGLKIGRNDPCPCGSDKKYKHCGGEQPQPPKDGGTSALNLELREALAGQQCRTLAEAQSFAEHFLQQRNRAPNPEVQGLSPEPMFEFLHHPFDSPQRVQFLDPVEWVPDAPIMTLFELLTTAIAEQGLKATAKGNLPRDF